MRHGIKLGLLVLAPSLAFACGGAETTDSNKAREAQMLALEVSGDSEIEKYDLNGDGKADVWNYYNRVGKDAAMKRLLARKDLDLNHDERVDVRQAFNKDGEVVREERDLDFDGKLDATDYFFGGKLYKIEYATNFTQEPTIMKFFEDGVLVRKERDSNGDGKADVFEYYEDGKLKRVGYDRDGDSKPDFYEEGAGAQP